MISTFDNLLITLKDYQFDIVTMSETWLKDNSLLLQHVTIPGYSQVFRNRETRGGGVGIYIKESIKFKWRTDIESRYSQMEHLWIEVPGRNKNSKALIGTIYRSESHMNYADWLQAFDALLGDITISWDGLLLITGDFNVNLLDQASSMTRQYANILDSFNLIQHVTKPTRTTKSLATLIDHIILPCPLISDHDAPYCTLNIRISRYAPRYKFIRNEKQFNENAFVEDFSTIPFQVLYGLEDPDEKVEILQTLIQECLKRHAPLRRIKLTRPPAPWMNDLNIRSLQQQCRLMRFEAHKHQSSEEKWNAFRGVRNQLKTVIKKAKRTFTIKALSSRRPKDVSKVIHRILHPSSQPLRADPSLLNSHFASTAERVTGNQSTPTEKDLYHLI